MCAWPNSLEYPVEVIEMVATFIATDDLHVPDPVKRWALAALLDVSDATAQSPLFGEPGREVGDDWMPIR